MEKSTQLDEAMCHPQPEAGVMLAYYNTRFTLSCIFSDPQTVEEGLGVSFKTALKADQEWDRCFPSGFRQGHMGTTNSAQAPSAARN